MSKLILPIRGMHCRSCEMIIEQNLNKLAGVKKAKVDHKIGRAEIFYEGSAPDQEVLSQAIKNAGYSIGDKEKLSWFSRDWSDYKNLFWAMFILLGLYLLAKWFGIFTLDVDTSNAGLFTVLLVGLVAGISTCMALVGGLVLGLSARHAELHPEATSKQKFAPHLFFNLGRVIGFAFLGGLIGLVGGVFKMSTNTLGFMTVIVGLVMLFLGLKLIEIFPALRDKSLSLPKSIGRFLGIAKESKEYSHFGAFVAGILTFFLPCGFTQAVQLYAVSTGSFIQGAFIMSLFALGTALGLLGIGGLSSVFKGQRAKIFFATAGLAVIIFGIINISNGSRLVSFAQSPAGEGTDIVQSDKVQEIRMEQNSYGYRPNQFTVKQGVKVRWIINSTNPYSCASSLVVPAYGISRYLEKGENIIEFTPNKKGVIAFSCSMGMYRGKFIVE